MGTLLHSCADVHTAIELSFGMVSGVGVDVLDGATCLKEKGMFLAWFLVFFSICTPIHFSGWNDIFFAEKCVELGAAVSN